MTRTIRMSTLIAALGCALLAPAAADAQVGPPLDEAQPVSVISLSGPRFGLTALSAGIQQKVEELSGHSVLPIITQFGWQWETRFFSVEGGATGISEWVLLVGGLEQSLFLPSLTWIVGVRSSTGTEFGVGPNLTPAGTAMAFAGGITLRSGPIYIPINVAAVPSRSGLRVSILSGFNMRREPTKTAAR